MAHLSTGLYLVIFVAFVSDVMLQNCGPTPTVLPENCCNIPSFFSDNDLIRCKTARNNRAKRFATSRMELGTCYLDCVFELTGVTYGNVRVLNTNNLLKILVKETPNDQAATQVITNSVGHCISILNNGTMKIRNPTVANCSTIPSAIMMCIHKNFFLNCPINRFNFSVPCIQLKDFIGRCAVEL